MAGSDQCGGRMSVVDEPATIRAGMGPITAPIRPQANSVAPEAAQICREPKP